MVARGISQLGHNTKRPIILYGKHPISQLLVLAAHRQEEHSGIHKTRNLFQQTLWIKSDWSAIRRVTTHCYDFLNFVFLPTDHFRSALQRWWFDPFASKTADEFHKCYALIFTCLTTRAIHLEKRSDVSPAATIIASLPFLQALEPLYFSYQTTQRILSLPTRIHNSSSRVHHFKTSWQTRKFSLPHHLTFLR